MRWFSVLLLAISASAFANGERTLATYDMFYRGMPTGKVSVSVSRNTAQTYCEVKVLPGFLARMFGKGDIMLHGTVATEGLRPLEYFYHNKSRKKSYKYVYNWTNREVAVTTNIRTNTRKFKLDLYEGIRDPISTAMVMLRDLPNIALNYSVLTQGKLKVYQYHPAKPDMLEIEGESRRVWKLEHHRGKTLDEDPDEDSDKDSDEDNDMHVYTWHDPNRDFWMLKTVGTRDGTEIFRVELAEYTSGPVEN